MANQDIAAVHHKIVCGEVSGSTSAKILPSVEVCLVWLKANHTNTGYVYVGGAGVTVPQGTTDTNAGYPLAAGETLGPLSIANLGMLYIITTAVTDDIIYFGEA